MIGYQAVVMKAEHEVRYEAILAKYLLNIMFKQGISPFTHYGREYMSDIVYAIKGKPMNFISNESLIKLYILEMNKDWR